MGDESEDADKDRPARVANKYRELADHFEAQREFHARKTVEYGYASGLLRTAADMIQPMSDSPGFGTIEKTFEAFDQFARLQDQKPKAYDFDVSSSLYALTTANAYTAVASTSNSLGWSDAANLPLPPGWDSERNERFAARMEFIDPELGSLARSVWQTFHGGNEQAPRNALFDMRQLYDHFFHVMAHDEAVRNSDHFQRKQGENPNQVHRIERIEYAAATHVHDKALATSLVATAKELLAAHTNLNALHERRRIDAQSARPLLTSMQAELERWLAAMTKEEGSPGGRGSLTTVSMDEAAERAARRMPR